MGIGILGLVVILALVLWEVNIESNIFKRKVMSHAKTFYCHKSEYIGKYYLGESVTIEGAWNVTYKNSVRIDCNKENGECLLTQASLYSNGDMLDILKENFTIKEWNKNYIKAYDESMQYNYELNINLNTKDVTYIKHPLEKIGIFGNELETTIFTLYDGWKVDMNINEYIIKKTKWYKAPLTKIIHLLFPLKQDVKINLI